MGDKDVIQAILYYQQCLDKYTRRNDEERVLYCLSKLYKMPISIEHLQETGVGRTVNALRKLNGEVAEAAKTLVGKWKEMVTADNEDDESKDASKLESVKKNENETKDKSYKEKNSSSHSHSDKKKSRSMSVNDKNSRHSSNKTKEDTQCHKDHESRVKKKKEKHLKHNSSRRKRESSVESNLEESDCESKHRESAESSSDEKEVKQERHRRKERKPDSSDTGDESQECSKSKKKKYLVSEESEEEPRKHSHKSSKHRHENKEKLKYIHKKNEEVNRDKRKKKDDTKSKEKHSSKSNSNGTNKKSKDREIVSKQSSTKQKSRKSISSEKPSSSMGSSGIDSGSGASFAEALGMLMPSSSKSAKKKVAVVHPRTVDNPTSYSRELSPEVLSTKAVDLLSPKKLAPLDINLDNLLPEITPHYKPLGLPLDNGMSRNKLSSEDDTLSAIMYNKISRTKVYSGNKVTWGKVPTLFEICTRVLQDNIDALEYTGGVPYLILKPVIERANPNQLFLLEHHNPYLIDETDELWQLHCNKLFRTKIREEMETWRDMYLRCFDERETKLKALTANIKQSQDKSLPVRQTKLAYVDSIVKPPRNVARKQAKHGTGGTEKKPVITPSSRLSTLATSGAAGQVSVPNPGIRAVNNTGNIIFNLISDVILQHVELILENHRSHDSRESVIQVNKHPIESKKKKDYSSIKAMSRSQKIVELARKQYTESNPQSTWMVLLSNFDDQLKNLEDDGDRYKVKSDSCSKHSDHHIKTLKKQ
ncbi:hypothetical protein FQA39_LY11303 [Lamprigera yunnana]|nr:hypothetical protein FQA39_LY11303 [Lamprigera yunnana]